MSEEISELRPKPREENKPEEVAPEKADEVELPKPTPVSKSPIWKINPDGTKTQLESLPHIQATNRAVLWRADELIRGYGYSPEQAKERIIEEVQSGELDCSPPQASQRNADWDIQASPEKEQQEIDQKQAVFMDAYYRYLQAAVRLEAGQVNGLPLGDLEDIAMLITRPLKPMDQWAKAVGINIDEQKA